MTGSGNDFVIVDARVSPPEEWAAADIQAVCARATGVGADGVVFVGPGSEPGAARMIYFNSDGSRAAMCGNAALCSAWLAARLDIAAGAAMRLETDAATYDVRAAPDDYRAALHLAPIAQPTSLPSLRTAPGESRVALATVGVPHLVVLVDDVEGVDLATRGRALRFDASLGPDGANVNFVSPTSDPAVWRLRTYERGIEGETLACGTGSVAAGCALSDWGLARLPLAVRCTSGRVLGIRARRAENGYDDVWLEGEARPVFRGVLT